MARLQYCPWKNDIDPTKIERDDFYQIGLIDNVPGDPDISKKFQFVKKKKSENFYLK